jgi:hypothetical protein
LNDLADLEIAIRAAVGDQSKDGRRLVNLLDKYKDHLSMVRDVITLNVVRQAVENEYCGEQIVTILVDQFKAEVCRSIDEYLLKLAARNLQFGSQIMGKLLKDYKDRVISNLSSLAIAAAAENPTHAEGILRLLLEADEEKVRSIVIEIYRSAGESKSWMAEVRPKLEAVLREIRHPIGYPMTSGGLVEQNLPGVKGREQVDTERDLFT